MLCVDVNVLVYAHRPESPDHGRWKAWLDHTCRGAEPLALVGAVASGFVRIVTHPRIFNDPTPTELALGFVEALRASPTVVSVEPGARHWAVFADLCRQTGAAGNRVPDAALAAAAIESGATFVTADRGFARFPGLRVEHPV